MTHGMLVEVRGQACGVLSHLLLSHRPREQSQAILLALPGNTIPDDEKSVLSKSWPKIALLGCRQKEQSQASVHREATLLVCSICKS